MDRSVETTGSLNVVAVVDDDPAVRDSLKFSLEIEGLAVRAFAAGEELIESIGNEPICCFVIEYRLQDINGLDLADRLRQSGVRAPIIMLASHPNRMLRRQAAQRNIPIVEKPLIGNALTDTLRQLLI
jgi:FixJ family two-component response regulator